MAQEKDAREIERLFDEVLDRCRRMGILPTFGSLRDVLDAISRWHLEKKPNIQFRKDAVALKAIQALKQLGRSPRSRDKRQLCAKRLEWACTPDVPNIVFPTWGSMMEFLRREFLSVTGEYNPKKGWLPGPYDHLKLTSLLSVIERVSALNPALLQPFGGEIPPRNVSLTTYDYPKFRLSWRQSSRVNYRVAWASLGALAARTLLRYAERRYGGDYTKPVFECQACRKLFVANRVTVKRDVDWDPRTGRKLTKVIAYPRACSRRCQDKLKNQAAKQKKLRLHDGPRS